MSYDISIIISCILAALLVAIFIIQLIDEYLVKYANIKKKNYIKQIYCNGHIVIVIYKPFWYKNIVPLDTVMHETKKHLVSNHPDFSGFVYLINSGKCKIESICKYKI